MNAAIQLISKNSLILTKLQPPLLRRTTLLRERLATIVRAAIDRRLTLVCAGAGYGKTTLIANSFDDAPHPIVWYSLGRSDNDLITFFSYLTTGLDAEFPGIAQAIREALDQVSESPTRALISACVNELVAYAQRDFVLVLDDFQLVEQTAAVVEMLDQLICHAPPQVHFVIATRAAPTFACLPRLRAEGQAIEIGEQDLRFQSEEADALFDQCLQLQPLDVQMRALIEQIEGWALGLLMAGQSLKSNSHSPVTSLENVTDRRVLFGYLSEEVMRQQPSDLVDFLTSSAILSWLESSVCDAALGRVDSAKHLKRLEQQCLFVIPTSDGYLRYHRLFREFLLQQLANDPARAEALHRRAAVYFEEHQDFETAIFHWFESGDHRQAARLISAISEEMLRAARFDTLSFWFGRLSEAEFAEFPELIVRQGQLCEARDEWDHALEYYERAVQAYTARGDLIGLSQVLRSKGYVLDWRKGEHIEAERLHREALSYVGDEYRRQRAALIASLARDQLSAGNTAAAQTLYQEALALHGSDRQGQLDTLLNPGSWLFHSLGDFTQAISVLRRAERLAYELNNSCQLAETYNNLSVNLYFLGRYAESLDYAEKALALGRALGDPHQEAYALMNQANAFEMTCRMSYTDLYQQYEHTLRIEQALGDRRFSIAILVFMMILSRRGGDPAQAAQYGAQALTLARERGLRWLTGFVLVQLGAARIWLDSDDASTALEQALQIFVDCGDQFHSMVAHFWLATLYHSESNSAFLPHLRECLQIAVAHQYDYFFRTEIQASIPLLVSALENDLWSAYVVPILVKLGPAVADSLRPLLSHSNKSVRDHAQVALKEMGITLPTSRRTQAFVPQLTIRVFGNFCVWRGEQLIEEREWGRRKSKRLLKILALSPGHALPKDMIVELMWGDADPQAANANFYRTLYNLRRVLEPLAPHSGANYITLDGGVVALTNELIARIDVDEFVFGVEEARKFARLGNRTMALNTFVSVAELYKDDLSTDDLYDDWVQPKREQLLQLYLGALKEMGKLAQATGDVERAIEYLRLAFQRDSTSEQLCLTLLQCLVQVGRRSDALQYYATCEKALADLDLTPSAELRAAKRALFDTRAPA
ncbi:MAG: tetratricopeptide repeat protein [Chloroflexi bacterium]|nr:tetratricopeptide repeat protein [Chloroflexota bacterium]